jgi:tryptophan halogenase
MKIVIVGGGTAGWLSAAILAKMTNTNYDITVIESTNIPTIGVGEGSVGSFPWVLNGELLNWPKGLINEIDFLRKTKGTLKLGVKLDNWKGDGSYIYSPIIGSFTQLKPTDTSFLGSILENGRGDMSSIVYYWLENKKTPFLKDKKSTPILPGSYTYHFDGNEVGKYFKELSIKYGVKCINADVNDVILDENDYITSIKLDNWIDIKADLFVDCTGFSKVLVGKTKNKWISFKDNLITNAAIPYSENVSSRTINFYTEAKAMNAGWNWKIPLQNRNGCGYVYCDAFQSFDESIKELQSKFGNDILPTRNIKFESGRYEKLWYNNLLCSGLSSHFLEPLQATSIHITITTIAHFIQHFARNDESIKSELIRKKFNENMGAVIDDYRDLIQMIYLAGRDDTPFWKFVKNEMKITEKNKELLEISKYRCPIPKDIDSSAGMSGWGVWCHILENAGLFSKDKIEKELKTFGLFETSKLEAKKIKNEYKNYEPKICSVEEFYKYLKI